MSWIKKQASPNLNKESVKMSWKLVAGGEVLRGQVNKRWPDRDKRSDGAKGDAAHADRVSDHNPDSKGLVHALDIDEDLKGSKNDNVWFSDQLIAYARGRKPGSERLKNIVYENRVASGTYASNFWTWRNGNYGHDIHMHVSFSTQGENDSMLFQVPMLMTSGNQWDGAVPFFDVLMDSSKNTIPNKATWRLACRLSELGFFDGPVQPDGKQAFPTKAIKNMQDYMGWVRAPYDAKTHKSIWKELTLSHAAP
jgi:hypothetical protein